MKPHSAGILLFRKSAGRVEVLLVHPGGPLWAKKDEHAWTIPKGEIDIDEPPMAAAQRELKEETGITVAGELLPLGFVTQRSGKMAHAWAVEQDADAEAVHSNTFELEWPPRSGQRRTFPEIDRGAWFDLEEAKTKINEAQAAFLDRLAAAVYGPP